MTRRLSLVLTATIVPDARVHKLARVDVRTRLDDYLWAIGRWRLVEGFLSEIIVVDNSLELEESQKKEISTALGPIGSFFRFPQKVSPKGTAHQKGRGEAALLDQFMKSQGDAHDLVLKCTGRLWLRNAKSFLKGVRSLHSDLAHRPSSNTQQCDTRLFAVNPAVWNTCLSGMAETIDEERGVYLEHVFRDRLTRFSQDAGSVATFSPIPNIRGFSGSTGEPYGGLVADSRWVWRSMASRLEVIRGVKSGAR